MSNKCPYCGAEMLTNPRFSLLAHLRTWVKQAQSAVEGAERSKPEYPFNLLASRIRRRDKYQSWLDLVEAEGDQ